MAALSQIQVTFSETEDRLLLRLNTLTKEEFRFTLTRRFVKRLMPALNRSFENTPEVAAQTSISNKEAVKNFEREKVSQQTDFQTPFSDAVESFPLGKSAILVSHAKLVPQAEGGFMLALKDEKNKGIDFTFKTDVLYLLHSLLQETLQKTDWDLELTPPPPQQTAEKEQRVLN
jgi:hypothetical protein